MTLSFEINRINNLQQKRKDAKAEDLERTVVVASRSADDEAPTSHPRGIPGPLSGQEATRLGRVPVFLTWIKIMVNMSNVENLRAGKSSRPPEPTSIATHSLLPSLKYAYITHGSEATWSEVQKRERL
ncbi:Endoribonuclease Ybey [Manis pentadactyla]|nr:Endoribonuclease Ybey [Manis pentadactyla]